MKKKNPLTPGSKNLQAAVPNKHFYKDVLILTPFFDLNRYMIYQLTFNIDFHQHMLNLTQMPVTIFSLSRTLLIQWIQQRHQCSPNHTSKPFKSWPIIDLPNALKTCKSGIKTIKSFSDSWSRPLSSVVLSPLKP